jgi:hypothetical protein
MHAPTPYLPETPSSRELSAPDWRGAARLLAAAALFGAIVGSVGCSSSSNPVGGREGPTFGGGRFCPWSAQIVNLELTP